MILDWRLATTFFSGMGYQKIGHFVFDMLFVKVGHFVFDMLLFNYPEKKKVDSEDLLACSTTLSQTKLVCKLAPARVAEALLHSTSPSISMYKIINIVQRLLRHRTRPSSEGINARKKNQNLDQKRIFFLHTAAEKKLNL